MKRRSKSALILGFIPFLTLVFALPFVNRIRPIVFGLPFILFWILLWVALTPLILWAAYYLEQKNGSSDQGEKP